MAPSGCLSKLMFSESLVTCSLTSHTRFQNSETVWTGIFSMSNSIARHFD